MKRKRSSFVLSTVVATLLFNFSGCSQMNLTEYDSEDAKKSVNKEKLNHERDSLYDEAKKEEVDVDRYIDFSTTITLKTALNRLSNIENRVYMLSKNSKNIEVMQCLNSKLLKINSFNTLKQYIEDTTNFTLLVTKNKFYKNAPKIIKAIDKAEVKNSLSSIRFQAIGKINVQDALNTIAKKSGFSVIYTNMSKQGKTSISSGSSGKNPISGDIFGSSEEFGFINERIYFSGNNAEEFLNFIRDYFDVYTSVNYDTKIISISKYKTKIFNNLLYHGVDFSKLVDKSNRISIQNTDSNNGTSASSSGGGEELLNATGNKQDIETAVEAIIPNATSYFDEKSGNLAVTSTYSDMKKIENYLRSMDETYNKRIDIEISVYELAISNSYGYGIDLQGSHTNQVSDSKTESGNILTDYISKTLLSVGNTVNSGSVTSSITASLESDNEYLKILNFNTFRAKVTNNILSTMDIATSTDYLKNIISNVTTTTTSPVTTTTTEVAQTRDGSKVKVLPRIVGNEIFIKARISISRLIDMTERVIGEETISLPKSSDKIIPASVKLYSGERKVIASYTTYDRADKYKGILPFEKFALGGVNGEKYIKKELIFVISAKEAE